MKIVFGLVVVALIFGGIIWLKNTPNANKVSSQETSGNPVEMIDGKQVIQIRAKGGYFPMSIDATAGIPTILRVSTSGTFDCSSAIRVPSMDISKNLPPTGKTDIDLGIPEAGKLAGTCGMGMYPFEINFQS